MTTSSAQIDPLGAMAGIMPGSPTAASSDPMKGAAHHARELAKAMAEWPDYMRFSVTIRPHDADQPLFWLAMADIPDSF